MRILVFVYYEQKQQKYLCKRTSLFAKMFLHLGAKKREKAAHRWQKSGAFGHFCCNFAQFDVKIDKNDENTLDFFTLYVII